MGTLKSKSILILYVPLFASFYLYKKCFSQNENCNHIDVTVLLGIVEGETAFHSVTDAEVSEL